MFKYLDLFFLYLHSQLLLSYPDFSLVPSTSHNIVSQNSSPFHTEFIGEPARSNLQDTFQSYLGEKLNILVIFHFSKSPIGSTAQLSLPVFSLFLDQTESCEETTTCDPPAPSLACPVYCLAMSPQLHFQCRLFS